MDDDIFQEIATNLKKEIQKELTKLGKMSAEELVEDRQKKFRRICEIEEENNVVKK